MTTIACDGKSMGGDGCATSDGTFCSWNTVKVFRLKDGSLHGSCGEDGDGQRHRAWVDGGCEGDPPPGLGRDFGFLVLRPDGVLYEGGSNGILCEIEAPFAIGSGYRLAIGVMDAGASVERALEIASKWDPFTGGKITVLPLKEEDR